MTKGKMKNIDQAPDDRNKIIAPSDAEQAPGDFTSELREPRWSVVSFENRVAKNLSYEEAARKIIELENQKISGLCIITDEAAERISSGN